MTRANESAPNSHGAREGAGTPSAGKYTASPALCQAGAFGESFYCGPDRYVYREPGAILGPSLAVTWRNSWHAIHDALLELLARWEAGA